MLIERIKAWLKKPFNGDMDFTHWVLFLGFVTVIIILWVDVLKYITRTISSTLD
jgi:hypothetical protein